MGIKGEEKKLYDKWVDDITYSFLLSIKYLAHSKSCFIVRNMSDVWIFDTRYMFYADICFLSRFFY